MSSFTSTELEVMKILWEHGQLKPSQIQDKYCRPVNNAALRFQLKVLLEKGHIARHKVGKAYYYTAVTGRQHTFEKTAQRISAIFCKGSAAGLIAELIKTENLTRQEIEQLKQYIEIKASQTTVQKKGVKKS